MVESISVSTKSNSEIQKDFHYENRIGISDGEGILQKYVHEEVGLHNDHKGISKDNLENVIWDINNDDVDVVSVCGKDEIRDIEDNIDNF